jgi:hypothetical protein
MTGEDLPEILANVISSRSPPSVREAFPDIPAELDRLLLGCLRKEPSERPGSAQEVAAAIAGIAGAPGKNPPALP